MAITLYGYKKCGTCKKAEKHLEAKGVEYSFIDITEKPPSLAQLKKIHKLSGEDIAKFYNTSGKKYKEGNIKEVRKTLDEKGQLELLASDGYLLKRPLITDGSSATVGYKEDVIEATWC